MNRNAQHDISKLKVLNYAKENENESKTYRYFRIRGYEIVQCNQKYLLWPKHESDDSQLNAVHVRRTIAC